MSSSEEYKDWWSAFKGSLNKMNRQEIIAQGFIAFLLTLGAFTIGVVI